MPGTATQWSAVATVAIAIATIVNVFILGFQWSALKETNRIATGNIKAANQSAAAATASAEAAIEANKATRDHFREDRRPYIWLARFGAPELFVHPKRAPIGQITWSWYFINYGRSPAYKIKFTHGMNVGSDAAAQPRPFKGFKVAAPLPPNKEDWTTSVSEPAIHVTADEFSRLGGIDRTILVYGKFEYEDSYGARYETVFCFSRLALGGIQYCPEDGWNNIR